MGNYQTITQCMRPWFCIFPDDEPENYEMPSLAQTIAESQLLHDNRVLQRNTCVDIDNNYLQKIISAQ